MPSTEACPFSAITLDGVRFQVRLGCADAERQVPQFVRFDVRVVFTQVPSGCTSDRLEETVCYSEISQKLQEVCEKQEYRLIEKLGWEAYSALQPLLPAQARLWVRIMKERPPIPHLSESASFYLGDWNQF